MAKSPLYTPTFTSSSVSFSENVLKHTCDAKFLLMTLESYLYNLIFTCETKKCTNKANTCGPKKMRGVLENFFLEFSSNNLDSNS